MAYDSGKAQRLVRRVVDRRDPTKHLPAKKFAAKALIEEAQAALMVKKLGLTDGATPPGFGFDLSKMIFLEQNAAGNPTIRLDGGPTTEVDSLKFDPERSEFVYVPVPGETNMNDALHHVVARALEAMGATLEPDDYS